MNPQSMKWVYFWSSSQRTSWDALRGSWQLPRPPPRRHRRTSRPRLRRQASCSRQLEPTTRLGKLCARLDWTTANGWRIEERERGQLAVLLPAPQKLNCPLGMAHSYICVDAYSVKICLNINAHRLYDNATHTSLPFNIASCRQVAVQLLLTSTSLQVSKAHFCVLSQRVCLLI